MSQPILTTIDLRKSFGELEAVRGISFHVLQGEIFSLLGPNGAGKTTTISMLSGLLAPSSGTATLDGHDIGRDLLAAKKIIGVVPQEVALYDELTGRQNLSFWGQMYDMGGKALKQRIEEVLEIAGLAERANDRVQTYSGGMKRRLNIAAGLLHRPKILFMDEPTVGIDPQSRRHILDGVKDLQADGATILYTTHYMEEAQELSNHIAIMDQGQIIASGTHDELVHLVGEQDRIELGLSAPAAELLAEWQALPGASQVVAEDGQVTVLAEDSNALLPRLFDVANAHDVRITAVDIQEPNLESVFLHLTGRALRD